MYRQSSPFAAMTSKEQLERWREFQTIRLPYINGAVDAPPDEPAAEEPPKEQAPAQEQRPKTPPPRAAERAGWQVTRHKQYDAVLQRMRAASQKTTRYESVQ